MECLKFPWPKSKEWDKTIKFQPIFKIPSVNFEMAPRTPVQVEPMS